MAEEGGQRHAPGLDGIRAVAVFAITLYHLRFIDGGILSVSVFFTLSGYLITSILLSAFGKKGTIDLKDFWLRRARRLFPALLLLLVVVMAATAIDRANKLAVYWRQAVSASLYVANWATIARGDNYFNRFGGPGPFDHLWSLAIEEQFYALWPLLLIGLLIMGRRKRALLLTVTGALAAASAFAMAWRYVPHAVNNTRAYEGTDTRAAPMLIGAFTAMLLPLREVGGGGRRRRIALEVAGWVSCVVVVTVVLRTDEYSPFLYRGGEALVSIATAALVLAAAHPATFVGKAFGVAPLRWLGERTYGVYLWHMPIVAFMPMSALEGHPVVRGALQLTLIVVLAALSYALLEDPVRKHGVIDTFVEGTFLAVARRWATVTLLVPVAAAVLVALPFLSPASAKEADALVAELEAEEPNPHAAEVIPAMAPSKEAAQTTCTQLIHVGDSTSLGLISSRYLPDPEDRLEARYRSVGVDDFIGEIAGGRAIVEKYNNNVSAYEVVSSHDGYKGCWVFALGIGDASTILGHSEGLSMRIDWMMSRAGGTPVLWTTTKTLLKKGPYQNGNMEAWNRALLQACTRHANMRVYDWASEVQDDWFLPDQIHPNALGSKERAFRLAKALATAFPKDRPPPPDCMIRTAP
ncbi:MAG: acyltransferase family protein [Polyangiales bacterium]